MYVCLYMCVRSATVHNQSLYTESSADWIVKRIRHQKACDVSELQLLTQDSVVAIVSE